MLNGDSSQASETTPMEVTKKSIRNQTWQQLQKSKLCVGPAYPYNRVPNFVDSLEAVKALTQLPAFLEARHIAVSPDRVMQPIRLACLQAGKTLYVQPPSIRSYIMSQLSMPEGASHAELTEALTIKGLEQHAKRIGLTDSVSLDMIVIGSVAVSKDGFRIGRGNGYMNLFFALLCEINAIRPETTVVTVVHDAQVLDSIPSSLSGPQDFPIDLMVTPTQVLKAQSRGARPAGVMWSLLTARRMQRLPMLTQLRNTQIEAGKSCDLKEAESDAEEERPRGPRRFYRGKFGQRPRRNNTTNNGTHSESEIKEGADGENNRSNGRGKNPRPYYRRYNNRYGRPAHDDSEVTKRSFRDKAWQLLQKNHVSTTSRYPYNRIPCYQGAEQGAVLLRDSDTFRAATHVFVNMDKALEPFRLACLEEGKTLYILAPKLVNDVVIKVEVPRDEDPKPELKDIISKDGLEKYGKKIGFTDPLKLDLLIVSSVAISKEGYRIGNGNGYTDLCYALLREMKAIDVNTPIVTAVHDYQVFETLPTDLFGEQDIPIDVIVTPTQVLKAPQLKDKPRHVQWGLISPRRLSLMPILVTLRDQLLEQGHDCTLKEEDPKRRRRHNSDNQQVDGEAGDHARRGRRFYGRQRRSYTEKGENTEGAESGGNMSPDTTHRPKRRPKPYDFSIKLTNIERNLRIKDLRSALQERNVKPNSISWVGYKGFCYLHFLKNQPAKPEEQQPETPAPPAKELDPDSILEALADLTLYPSDAANTETDAAPQPNKLVVQLAKPQTTRIETADETAV